MINACISKKLFLKMIKKKKNMPFRLRKYFKQNLTKSNKLEIKSVVFLIVIY